MLVVRCVVWLAFGVSFELYVVWCCLTVVCCSLLVVSCECVLFVVCCLRLLSFDGWLVFVGVLCFVWLFLFVFGVVSNRASRLFVCLWVACCSVLCVLRVVRRLLLVACCGLWFVV